MSMPIQRQSEQFSVFDTGIRWERDRPQHELPRGLAGLVNSMGPRITGGMLNTRQAAIWDDHPEEYSLGFDEAYEEPHGAVGMTYDDDPDSPRSQAYDYGRDHGKATYYNEHPDEDPGSFSMYTQREQPFEEGTYFKEVPHLNSVRRSRGEHWPGHTSGLLNTRTAADSRWVEREAGWHYPEYDRTDYDPSADFYDDRPSRADFAEEEAELARKRNYPRGQGPAWNYSEDGDPDPDLESLENTADPERFISGSRRRLAVEEDYSGGDEDDPDWIRKNSPRQQEHNRKRGCRNRLPHAAGIAESAPSQSDGEQSLAHVEKQRGGRQPLAPGA